MPLPNPLKQKEQVKFALTFAPSVGSNADSAVIPTKFNGVAYTGGAVEYWGEKIAVDLSTLSFRETIFALLQHRADQRVGKCSLQNTGSQLLVNGEFSEANNNGKQVAAELAEGMPYQLSIGFSGTFAFYDKRTKVNVNGMELELDGLFLNANVYEVSFVIAGADGNTSVAGFSSELSESEFKPERIITVNEKVIEDKRDNELAATNAQLSARVIELQKEIDERNRKEREVKVKEFFKKTGIEWTEEKAKPFIELDNAAFEAITAPLIEAAKVKSEKPGYLFQVQGTGESVEDKESGKEKGTLKAIFDASKKIKAL